MIESLATLGSQAFTLALALLLLLWGRRLFWMVGGTMFAIVGLGLAALVLDPARFQVVLTETSFRFNMDTVILSPLYLIAAAVGAVIGIISSKTIAKYLPFRAHSVLSESASKTFQSGG